MEYRAFGAAASAGRHSCRPDADEAQFTRFGVFGTTLIAFFLAEMGDNTQIATMGAGRPVPRASASWLAPPWA